MEAKKLGAKILDDAEKVVKERGISVDKVLREGDIVKEIVAEAQKGGYDLIVLGHRGMSRLGELLLGAVSEGVSHKAPCPVLIVK
jgi:nucleotide-binding universal stress UspA family protein